MSNEKKKKSIVNEMTIESSLPLSKFLSQDPKKLNIEVANVHQKFMITTYEVTLDLYELDLNYSINKRYTEFAGLYDSLRMRYQNVTFPEFPSKYQLFNKTDDRKKFFTQLLKSLLKLVISHQESKKEVFKILYKFLTESASDEVGKLTCTTYDKDFQIRKSSGIVKNGNDKIERKETEDSFGFISKNDNFFEQNSGANNNEIKGWNIEYDFLRKGIKPSFNETLTKGFCKIEGKNIMIMDNIASNNFYIIMPLWRANYEFFSVSKNSSHAESLKDIEEVIEILNSRFAKLKDYKLDDVLEDTKLFIRINHDNDKSDLIISIQQNKSDLSQMLAFLESIVNSRNQNLDEEEVGKWKYIQRIDETNYYNYGKLKIDIDDIIFSCSQDINLFIRISIDPYVYRTRTIISKKIFLFKQMFLLPIHNRFDCLKFEIVMENNAGFFHKKYSEEKIAEFKLRIPDIMNGEYDNSNNHKEIEILDKDTETIFKVNHIEKGKINAYIPFKNLKIDEKLKKTLTDNEIPLKSSSTNVIEDKKEVNNENKDISFNSSKDKTSKIGANYITSNLSMDSKKVKSILNNKEFEDSGPLSTKNVNKKSSIDLNASKINQALILRFKVINLSTPYSVAKPIKNKFVLEEQYLKNEDDFSMKMLLKRLKRVVANIKNFTIFYKDIFRWAYPIYSLIMLIGFVIYFIITDLNYLGSHFIFLFLFILCGYSNLYQNKIKRYVDKVILSVKNKYLFNQTEVLNVDDLEDDECLMENYLIAEDKQKSSIIKTLLNYKEYKEKYNTILFKFSKFVSFIEKAKNLLFWTDPSLSFQLTVLLFLAFMVIYNMNLRYLLLFSIIKKFVVGKDFYKQKLENNIEVTTIILECLYNEWISNPTNFKYLKKNIKDINLLEIFKEVKILTEEGKVQDDLDIKNKTADLEIKKTKKIDNSGKDDSLSTDKINIYSLNLKQMSDDQIKIQTFIKDFFELHLDAVINLEKLSKLNTLGELKEYCEKSKSILKIQKRSNKYKDTISNSKILKPDIDIEDILYYYTLNVKSDLYTAKYYLDKGQFEESKES